MKDGGIFAVFVGGYPSVVDWRVEEAYSELSDKCAAVSYAQTKSASHNARNGISYIEAIQASGRFQYVKETACHSGETCTRQRLVELTLTQGSIHNALQADPSLQKDMAEFSDLIGGKLRRGVYCCFFIQNVACGEVMVCKYAAGIVFPHCGML